MAECERGEANVAYKSTGHTLTTIGEPPAARDADRTEERED